MYVWDVATRTLHTRQGGPPVFAAACARSSPRDGSGHVTIWYTATGTQLAPGLATRMDVSASLPHAVYGVGWSPNSARSTSTRYDGLLSGTRTRGATWPRCQRAISPTRSAWSPDGRLVATGNDHGRHSNLEHRYDQPREISSRVPSQAGPMRRHGRPTGLCFPFRAASACSRYGMSPAARNSRRFTTTADNKQLRGVVWLPDGLHLATGGDDGTGVWAFPREPGVARRVLRRP